MPSVANPVSPKKARESLTSPSMNNLTRWNWLKDLEAFQDSLDVLMRRSPTHRANGHNPLSVAMGSHAIMEISETATEYLIKTELPDTKNAVLNLGAQEGVWTITDQPASEPHPDVTEGACSPEVSVPAGVRIEHKNGVLYLHLPKESKSL